MVRFAIQTRSIQLMTSLVGGYSVLVLFLLYFFCKHHSISSMVHLLTHSCSDRTDPERRQKSYRVLMCLITLMFALQTVHNIINWYNMWLAFIDYGDNIDGSFLVLLGLDTTPSQFALFAVQELLVTFRLGIADSILANRKLFSNLTYTLYRK